MVVGRVLERDGDAVCAPAVAMVVRHQVLADLNHLPMCTRTRVRSVSTITTETVEHSVEFSRLEGNGVTIAMETHFGGLIFPWKCQVSFQHSPAVPYSLYYNRLLSANGCFDHS